MHELDIRNGCVGLSAEDSDAAVEYIDDDAAGSEYCGMISWPWMRFFTCILRRSRICSLEFDDECFGCIGKMGVADDPAAVKIICGIDIKIRIIQVNCTTQKIGWFPFVNADDLEKKLRFAIEFASTYRWPYDDVLIDYYFDLVGYVYINYPMTQFTSSQ